MTETRTNIRELALEALLEIEKEGRQSHTVIRQTLEKYGYLPRQDRAFFKRLCEGTLERRITLDHILNCFSRVKTGKMKPVLREILRMAVYQIGYMDAVPASAAVDEAVKLTKKKGLRGLAGYANGVLRTVEREWDRIRYPGREDPVSYLSVRYSMPEYLVRKWMEQLDGDGSFACTEQVCRGLMEKRPLTVRIRRMGNSLGETLESLKDQGVAAQPAPWPEGAFYLSGADRLASLDAFREGKLQVQDISSMLAVEAAGIKPGDLVLDLCAAPGGKSLLAADKTGPAGQVIARDLTEHKVELIRENIRRTGLENITAVQADASKPDPSLKERADVVLADVPCSGYGVIGRKPDIRYRACRENEQSLVLLQRQILAAAASCVKPGGTLVYSTCTICREENQENMDWFREHYPFRLDDLRPFWPEGPGTGTAEKGYRQLLPGADGCDGFFVARFVKRG